MKLIAQQMSSIYNKRVSYLKKRVQTEMVNVHLFHTNFAVEHWE
jgi:hypothetical protein